MAQTVNQEVVTLRTDCQVVFLAPILTQPLMQGLHSNDSRILDSVLNRADVTLIDNTFKRLPV